MAYTIKPKRGQGPSGQFVGGGRNQKTAARPEYQPGRAKKNDNGQIDQWIDQSPEPFRNSQASANPRIGYGVVRDPNTLISEPGKHPFRAPGRSVMGQGNMDAATGHSGGKGAGRTGRYSVTSGHPTNAPRKNTDNGSQPPSRFRTNRDLFNDDTEAMLKRWGR